MFIRRGCQPMEPHGEAMDMDADRLAMRLGVSVAEATDTLRAREARRAARILVHVRTPIPNWWGDDYELWNAERCALFREWMDAIQSEGCKLDFNEWLQPYRREEWKARPVALIAALLALMGGANDQARAGQEAN